ncbi:hypothetical protein DFH94DRAFT_718841 [Russula ochroleuca]|uniref:Secreted protein n=1 Tax=Russula ochroleuca TaxID=152965 RepID=A0A9P5N3F1_9AGAM|nr:hypothetical protein DFH94DRAFT_718841 [Russula ochroleuca]
MRQGLFLCFFSLLHLPPYPSLHLCWPSPLLPLPPLPCSKCKMEVCFIILDSIVNTKSDERMKQVDARHTAFYSAIRPRP